MEAQRANGEAAAAGDLPGSERQPGNPPVFNDVEPWRVASQAGPEGISLAVRTKRNAGKRGAPKPGSRPLSEHRHAAAAALDGKRKGVKGTLAALGCGSARLAQASDGSPISTQLPHARPGRVMRTRGAVDRAVRARLVSMPCRVGSRADGVERRRGARLAAPHFAGAKHVRVDRRRPRSVACARRCARVRSGRDGSACAS